MPLRKVLLISKFLGISNKKRRNWGENEIQMNISGTGRNVTKRLPNRSQVLAAHCSTLFLTTIMAAIPPQARSKTLRACLLCSIIQLPNEFKRNGCPNCEEILQVWLSFVSFCVMKCTCTFISSPTFLAFLTFETVRTLAPLLTKSSF